MLKRKRKINKAHLIVSSRRYRLPLPKAYASLLAAGVPAPKARAMVEDASSVLGCEDSSYLGSVVVWRYTKFFNDWLRAARCL